MRDQRIRYLKVLKVGIVIKFYSLQGIIPGRRSETGIKVFDFKLTETLVSTYFFIFLTKSTLLHFTLYTETL